MTKHGNGVTRQADTPLLDIKKKIESYYALLEDGRIQNLVEKEIITFNNETNKVYGQLTKEEREKCSKIKDAWKPRSVARIANIKTDFD